MIPIYSAKLNIHIIKNNNMNYKFTKLKKPRTVRLTGLIFCRRTRQSVTNWCRGRGTCISGRFYK